MSRTRGYLTCIDPPGRGLNKLSSWYVDGTSTTLALSAPDGWTNVLRGALLPAARTKALLFARCRDDLRRLDSIVVVLIAACRMDDRGGWDWMIKRTGSGETKVADALGLVTWFGRPRPERSVRPISDNSNFSRLASGRDFC